MLKLHEIELHSEDLDAMQNFYEKVVGVDFNFGDEYLKVFTLSNQTLDLDMTKDHPGKLRLGFITDNLDEVIDRVKSKNVKFDGPMSVHLGLREIRMLDPMGNIVAVHEPTEESPEFVKSVYMK